MEIVENNFSLLLKFITKYKKLIKKLKNYFLSTKYPIKKYEFFLIGYFLIESQQPIFDIRYFLVLACPYFLIIVKFTQSFCEEKHWSTKDPIKIYDYFF